ncbi:MAG: glycosyltransferase [Methyloglobulus sp.]|nr:glycosyltransferase [Methyloglobulus sp.]
MRIFYGVQGTGNGHITRARVMAKELYKAGIEVDFQFTGRAFDKYFDMTVFNGYQLRQGLTFAVENGQVNYLKTLLTSKPITFAKDVKRLDLTNYDLVISDFEPVTAWAAKAQGVPVLGLGHQYAFKHKIPREGSDPLAELVMKLYAPADIGIGLHWHHFGQPVLPPIIETYEGSTSAIKNKIIVYLPFEDTNTVISHLSPFNNFEFHIYTPEVVQSEHDFITCKPLSREGFQKDLIDCAGIISNAGFELASEALQMGKKILAKPLHAQMEQISNAAALQQLGYGHIMYDMDTKMIGHWLHNAHAVQITYPNTAKILVEWLQDGMQEMTTDYVENIWNTVDIKHIRN